MLFYKNLVKKKNFINYIITLFSIILIIIFLFLIDLYLEDKKNRIINSEENRTIIINQIVECNINYDLGRCYKKDNRTIIIASDISKIDQIVSKYKDNYTIVLNSDDNSSIENIVNIINMIRGISTLSQIAFLIINLVLVYNFVNEDKKTISLLRCLGYSKEKLFVKMSGCYLIIFSSIYVASYMFFLFIFSTFLEKQILFLSMRHSLVIFFILAVENIVIYLLFFIILNKNKKIKC